jgi:hypothetical protein
MRKGQVKERVVGYQRFALLWRLSGELGIDFVSLSNTLFLMLDSLSDVQPLIKYVRFFCLCLSFFVKFFLLPCHFCFAL